jgi:EAL domain-containing protein (putative c-di-GMP-specific phosphodiesterase class I)/GGDEF domain-containing protein
VSSRPTIAESGSPAGQSRDDAREELLRILEREATAAREANGRLAVLIIELRRVDRLQALLQRPPSSAILSIAIDRLQAVLRVDDRVAALSEESVCLILPRISHPIQAVLAAVKCLRALEAPFVSNGETSVLRPGVGIVTVPEHPADPARLLVAADAASRLAITREESYHVYMPADAAQAEAGRSLELDLEHALRANDLEVNFQPQVDLRTGKAVGAEALLRWNHPSAGRISPERIVVLAENTGHIDSLTFWVLNAVLRNATLLARDGILPRFSVNLSTRVLVGSELPDIVAQALDTWNVPPGRITLEITESAMIGDEEKCLALLQRLRTIGVELSIDDFGTGYSSLAYLKRFPLDELKIDQEFVGTLLQDRGNQRIVRTVIDLARNFDLRTVAEGVKDQATADELGRMGCDLLQGYHISPPLYEHEFRDWWIAREAVT